MYVVVFNDSRLNWFESTLIVPCFSTMWQTKGKTLTLFWKTILSTCKQLKKIYIFLMKSKKLKKKFTSLVFSARDSCSWWICCEYSSTYNIRVSNLNKINFFSLKQYICSYNSNSWLAVNVSLYKFYQQIYNNTNEVFIHVLYTVCASWSRKGYNDNIVHCIPISLYWNDALFHSCSHYIVLVQKEN